ncbi:MAG: hypothetical protein ACRDPY_15205 [Streptosporangiaceae bacterium]
MADLTPAEWFDQFPPLADGAQWRENSMWCPRHWAPCPTLNANGIGAHTELMQIWINERRPKGSYSPAALNRHLVADSPVCCKLGDDRMYELWGHWPPAKPTEPGEATG